MTREDAVTTLKDISEMVHKQKEIEKSTLYGILDSNNEPIEALDMAIKALEQEPCEDCISRKEAIKRFIGWWSDMLENHEEKEDFADILKDLPSIQPKTELETWEGIHAQVTAPKGTFDKIWNEAEEDNDEV